LVNESVRGQRHNSEQTKQFFDQWNLYQQIVEHDYMAHRSIHAALRVFVVAQMDKPFTLLDFGCGDASAILATFVGTKLQAYTGVDLSPVALNQAAHNLAAAPFEFKLVEDDFTHYLAHNPSERFEAILAGFALHHLYYEEKCEFFKRCQAKLTQPGYLVLYDVFRRPGETRDEYLQAYCQHCREDWLQISSETLSSAMDHILTCDYPETYETLAMMASDAGFTAASAPLFKDSSQFHCLYTFQTQAE